MTMWCVCDMTMCVWHDSSSRHPLFSLMSRKCCTVRHVAVACETRRILFVAWLIHMCVWHDAFTCETWRDDVCDVTRHIDVCVKCWCVCMTYWCVCDILMCVWHIDVCATYWCVFDILMCVWHVGVCVTYWCVCDILMCAWHIDVCLTCWCVCDILMCVKHIDVCATYWCVCDMSRHRQTPSRTSCAARAVSALRHSCVLHHTIQIHVYVFEALWRSHSA